MRKPSAYKTQKGAIAIIMVFIVIVVISGMLVTVLSMSSSTVNDSTQQKFQSQANYMAESALEQAKYYLSNPDCNNIPNTGVRTLGLGTYEINTATDGSGDCLVSVTGESNGIVSYFFEKKITLVSGANSGNYLEPFPSGTDFTSDWNLNVSGTSQWVTDNCNATCQGVTGVVATGGSFEAYVINSGNSKLYNTGSRDRVIPTIITGSTGVSLDLTGGFWKFTTSAQTAFKHEVSISIYDSSDEAGTLILLWQDVAKPTSGVWEPITTTTALSANIQYDRLRINFNLAAFKNRNPYTYLDEIQLVW